MADLRDELARAMEYGMAHRPDPEGAPGHDLSMGGEFVPEDIYDHPEWYGGGPSTPDFDSTVKAIRDMRGNPDKEVTIHRAAPKAELNNGDWVSLSKGYAAWHVRDDNDKVHTFKVKAKDLRWPGDDLNEFGYFGEGIPEAAPADSQVAKTLEAMQQGRGEAGEANKVKEALELAAAQEDPLASLKQEALKYKSADEFVKAQGDTHYHGSNQDLNTLDFNRKAPKGNELPYGVHFTQDKQLAGDFANGSTKGAPMVGKINEAQINTKNAFDARKLVNKEGEPNYAILKEIADKSGLTGLPEHYGPYGYTMKPMAGSVRAIDTKTVLDNAKPSVIKAVLKAHGYDPAIKYSMRGASDPMGGGAPVYTDAIAVLDKNLVKSKQQLTDLYHQAHSEAGKGSDSEVAKTLDRAARAKKSK